MYTYNYDLCLHDDFITRPGDVPEVPSSAMIRLSRIRAVHLGDGLDFVTKPGGAA